jgi:hypothetical protein
MVSPVEMLRPQLGIAIDAFSDTLLRRRVDVLTDQNRSVRSLLLPFALSFHKRLLRLSNARCGGTRAADSHFCVCRLLPVLAASDVAPPIDYPDLGGLYLGRDFTILCHYSPLLTLIAWGASAVVSFRPAPILRFGASHVLEIYNVQLMRTNKLDDVSGVCITTIQRLFSMTRSQPKRMPISSPITPMLA